MKTREELQKYLSELVNKLKEMQMSNNEDIEYFDEINIKNISIIFYYTNSNKKLEMQVLDSGITIEVNILDNVSSSDLYQNALILIAENYLDK